MKIDVKRLIALLLLTSCGSGQMTQEANPIVHPPPPPPPPPSPSSNVEIQQAVRAAMQVGFGECEDVLKIRKIPLKGELGVDPAYDRVMVNFSSYQPCLIRMILDTTPTEDRSEAPSRHPFFVGDLAYDLIINSGKLNYQECMPDKIKASYQQIGYFAFHEWLHEEGNRKNLYKCVSNKMNSIGSKAGG